MKISVIGAGYVGLVSAAGLAHFGHSVVCIDTDNERVALVNRGISPLHEAGLGDLLSRSVISEGSLKASTKYGGILDTDITLICVGTPSNSDGSIDLSHVSEASGSIGSVLKEKDGYHLVVIRSTVIPRTTMDVVIPLLEKYSGKKVGEDIGIAFNPEFLQEGKAVQAFFNPAQIFFRFRRKRGFDFLKKIFQGVIKDRAF